MGASNLGSRAVIGEFFRRLNQNDGMGWVPFVSMPFQSNQESESYAWLAQAPVMREWIGGRLAKGLSDHVITLINRPYEATLEVYTDELRRDKTGQIMIRIAELARRTNAHWAKLLNTLIVNGETGTAYDGKNFFSTTHEEGDSGAQSNLISINVADPSAPTAAEMESIILQASTAIIAYKDDQGEPLNEDANRFLVMVPTSMMAAAAAATKNPVIVDTNGARTNTLTNLGGFGFELAVNPRLTDTTELYMFRSDSEVKPFIRQEETGVKVEAIAEGSEEEFKNRRHLYGVSAYRTAGYGMWQDAVKIQLT